MNLYRIVLLFAFVCVFDAKADTERQKIQLRLQPIGQVLVDADKAPVVKKEPGQDVFEHYCTVCHKEGLAGAPRFQNEQDWKPRLAGRTLDDLVASSIKGLNAMPQKGTCLKCSEEDLKAAISYMLPKS